MSRKYKEFPYTLFPTLPTPQHTHTHGLPYHEYPTPVCAFVIIHEPASTHHYQPVHSLHYGSLFVLYILWVWINIQDRYLTVSYGVFSLPLKSLCSTYSSLRPPKPLANTDIFCIASIVLLFPECQSWNYTVCNLFILASLT